MKSESMNRLETLNGRVNEAKLVTLLTFKLLESAVGLSAYAIGKRDARRDRSDGSSGWTWKRPRTKPDEDVVAEIVRNANFRGKDVVEGEIVS